MYSIKEFDGCNDVESTFDDFASAKDCFDKADSRGRSPLMAIMRNNVRVALIDDPAGFADCVFTLRRERTAAG